jgi:hypothetical protein
MNALDPIRARLATATPGPWEEYWQGHIHAPANYPQAAAVSICQTFGREDRVHPNAALIAHAPTDLAKLVSAVEAVEKVAAELDQDSAGRGLDLIEDDDFDRGWHGASRAAVHRIRVALATALGEAP